ncbi:MAG: mechanosensitive ion channel family protein [Euzebya sp.]
MSLLPLAVALPFLAQGTPGDPCPAAGAICETVLERTGNGPLAALLGQVIPILITIILIFIVAAILTRVAKRLIHRVVTRTANESRDVMRAITRRSPIMKAAADTEQRVAIDARRVQRTETIAAVLGSIAVFIVYLIAVFVALAKVNIEVGPLVAGAGVIGVALGFGAQSLVKDFLSGVFMILEDQYGVGDIIDAGEATGTVEGVTLRVTRLRDVEGTVWHIPNGEIRRVGNLSQLWSRSLLDIGVAYDTDLDHAGEVITRIATEMAQHPDWAESILEPAELWGVQQFGPSEVVLRLVIKTQAASQWKVNREFRARIKKAFDAEGIEIPFPQRTVWLRSEGTPVAAGVPEAAQSSVDSEQS